MALQFAWCGTLTLNATEFTAWPKARAEIQGNIARGHSSHYEICHVVEGADGQRVVNFRVEEVALFLSVFLGRALQAAVCVRQHS